ncbi:MAG TPA: KUP/HAK/KT family potassium transporter [Kofleriaceae bacterium]|nr:KUP/HAK/KT family potassium transporter [Kofleriaceae bacterium]
MNDAAKADPTHHGTRRSAHGHSGNAAHGGTGAVGHHGAGHHAHTRKEVAWLSLGALGVVYGDIGTSPLYAMRECFGATNPHHVTAAEANNVLGVLSLVFWSLLIVVFVKYLAVVLRADNKGEGGTLALAALVQRSIGDKKRSRLGIPILLALFGTGLLYGEGLITPAISVLSAVEGLSEQNENLSHLVIPISVAILVGLFWVQRYGTGKIGSIFGWVMLLWFFSIGAAGVPAIIGNPHVLAAASPTYAVQFLAHHGWHGFLLLGSVVLCVTGCEALYADMGHFGKTPIRIAWSIVVFPGLLLNYFGQGALYLENGSSVTSPFYGLVEGPLLIPMVILATMAAIIASQALISGAFSLTNQAVQLGYFPRVTVVHTSSKHEGQIYIPEINYFFMIACVALVLAFQTSSNLAAAYGIAVTGLFMITSFLIFLVCQRNWGWSLGAALALYIPLVVIDGAFFSSNLVKIAAGGWFPLAVGTGVFAIMTTWWRGRHELSQMMETGTIPEDLFLEDIKETPLPRVPGTAVFMASGSNGIPNVLLHHVKHNKVLHKQVVLLSVVTEPVPFTIGNSAIEVRELGNKQQGFYRVVARVGFMQQPNVPKILARCEKHHLHVNDADTTYYLGRQTLLTTGKSRIAKWRKMLFSFLSVNSRTPTAFFGLPPNRVVELGLQIEL